MYHRDVYFHVIQVHVHVLLCLVCLFDHACFFLSSFSSLIYCMYRRMYVHIPGSLVGSVSCLCWPCPVHLVAVQSLYSLDQPINKDVHVSGPARTNLHTVLPNVKVG